MDQLAGGEMDRDKVDAESAEITEIGEMDRGVVTAASAVVLAPKKKHGGQNVHRPNDTTKRQVNGMALAGLTHDRIAKFIGISDESLRKHYKAELEAETAVLGAVAQGLAQRAMDGDTISAIFYLKARGGWRDQHMKIDANVAVHDSAKHRLLDMLTAKTIDQK